MSLFPCSSLLSLLLNILFESSFTAFNNHFIIVMDLHINLVIMHPNGVLWLITFQSVHALLIKLFIFKQFLKLKIIENFSTSYMILGHIKINY